MIDGLLSGRCVKCLIEIETGALEFFKYSEKNVCSLLS